MKSILKIVSVAGLVLTLLPSILVFMDLLELQQHKMLALVGSVMWLGTAPFWLNKNKQADQV